MVWSVARRVARRLRGSGTSSAAAPLTTEHLHAWATGPFPSDPTEFTRRLASEAPRWLRGVWTVRDPDYAATVMGLLPALLERVDPAVWTAAAPSWAKVAGHHVVRHDLAGLQDFLTRGGLDLKRHGGSLESVGPVVHLPGWDDAQIDRSSFVLTAAETPLEALIRRAVWDGDALVLVVTAGFRHLDAPGHVPEVAFSLAGRPVPAVHTDERFGHREAAWNETLDRCSWQLRLPAVDLADPAPLHAEVTLAGRTVRGPVDARDPISSAVVLRPRLVAGRWRGLTADGQVGVVPAPDVEPDAVLVAWRLTEDAIVVDGQGPATVAELVTAQGRIPATRVDSDGLRFTATFPNRVARWGREARPLTLGEVRVLVDGRTLPAGTALAATVPSDLRTTLLAAHTQVTADPEGRTTVGLRIVPPREPRENTMYGQRELRRWYRDLDVEVDPDLALFQCYWAEVATDSQVPIFEEMVRRRPGLRAHWGVRDHAVHVPDGATPVITGTRAWYEILASAGHLVKNTEVGEYTRLRPGQQYLQTFHGQPFKRMGAAFWRETKGWPEFRVRWEATTRRSDFWSMILTPDPAANRWYRENYAYEGPFLDRGLPRTDPLVGPGAAERRARTRAALGIAPDQVAVLHATTWREDLSRGNNQASDPAFLDVAALAADLGPGHVILQRSHHSVARSDAPRTAEAGVLNVTDHPEINDLILASDVAILDYSSLRFETALVGLPMVFFVPDLDEYEGQLRGFLFDFAESAPGPLVRDAAQLADLVRDPGRIRAEFAGAIEAFNRRFNAHHDGHAASRVVDALFGGTWWDA